jgi:glutamate-5-semialdehyde dehydrogenase
MEMGKAAKAAALCLGDTSSDLRNDALLQIKKEILKNQEKILLANQKDLDNAVQNGMSAAMQDRLTINSSRISSMCESIDKLVALDDPIGGMDEMVRRPNGLLIGKKRVPLGVIGIIYESRPNVTVDAATLCLKSANAVILRGGKEAIHTNVALCNLMQNAFTSLGLPKECVQIIESTDRKTAEEMMRLNEYIDVLIPRGGAGLIKAVISEATVPVIETGVGNCHIFVDSSADLSMATSILDNSKTSRPSVCNAAESLLVCEDIAPVFLPMAFEKLSEKQVEFRGCESTCRILPMAKPATEDDYATEFLDYILSVRVVKNINEAIAHIRKYSTGHSEAIVTASYQNAQQFLDQVDAAAVYVNASTRFTDGFEMGLGSEIGISTQKLHARGPMGLKELTTIKYVIYGDGQIR